MRHLNGCSQPEDLKSVSVSGGHREKQAVTNYLKRVGKDHQIKYYLDRLRYCPSCDVFQTIIGGMAEVKDYQD